jgi:hypothetical protein
LLQRIVDYLDKWKQAGKSRVGRFEILLVIAKTNPEFVVLDLEVNSGYIDAKHAQYALIIFRIDTQGRESGRV